MYHNPVHIVHSNNLTCIHIVCLCIIAISFNYLSLPVPYLFSLISLFSKDVKQQILLLLLVEISPVLSFSKYKDKAVLNIFTSNIFLHLKNKFLI